MIIVKNKTPLKAIDDITCYKVAFLKRNRVFSLETLKELHEHTVASNIDIRHEKLSDDYIITSPETQTYILLEDAIKKSIFDAVVFECTIPRGTNYYYNNYKLISEELVINYSKCYRVQRCKFESGKLV